MQRNPGRPLAWRSTVLLTVLALLPVMLLTTASLVLSSRAVSGEVAQRVRTTADVSAVFVDQQTASLTGLVASYAERPGLVAALTPGGGIDHAAALVHLGSLFANQQGISGVFLADMGGTVTDVLPASPGVVGGNFAFRDWFKGVVARPVCVGGVPDRVGREPSGGRGRRLCPPADWPPPRRHSSDLQP